MNENTINNRAKKLNLKVQNYCDKEYYLTDLSNHAVAPGPMTLEQLDSWIGYLEGTPTPSFSNNFKFAQKDRLRAAYAICESLKDYARKYVVCSDNEREIIIDQINSISYTIFPCLDNDTISITADSFSDLKRKIEAKNDTPDIHRSNMAGQIEIMKELLFSF